MPISWPIINEQGPNKNQPFVIKEGQNNEQGSLVIDGEFVPCNDEVKEPPKRRIVGNQSLRCQHSKSKASSNNNGAIDPVASLLTTQTQEERV